MAPVDRLTSVAILAAAFLSGDSYAFTPLNTFRPSASTSPTALNAEKFELAVDMPPSGSELQANLKFDSVLPGPSEVVVVKYDLPFGLDVAPKGGLAVCTKDGEGGERVGDVLRYTSAWAMGLPQGDGLLTTAASFGGALSWRCYLFDVLRAGRWEEVVEALTSNVESRTDQVLLVFERPIED
eukprot:CAMPEP_0183293816 /NCGR_PEP_ID=MMETSP0160_2-20130417/2370_1 /TAXON_ID=2839 ORGANISM="Odontella Sinensis, Strain Grunow 1884" /NCGR_SAMPLE_ID=MMETSP0160_2 /ASSEMBLY_ACC=CAM_ASM_000250 /LENGTH=182 /DNA_ID=CAMNT_0025455005 /DNA_START=81 /DNA_END=629 /DNA_ORIENTATION=-